MFNDIILKVINCKGTRMAAVQQLLYTGAGGAEDVPVVCPDPEATLVRDQPGGQAAQAQGLPLLSQLG